MERLPLEWDREAGGFRHRHIRSVSWVCYTIHKELLFPLRQPPVLNDIYYGPTLSAEYPGPRSQAAGLPACNLFPSDIKLKNIKSRVFESLCSATSLHKSGEDILLAIRVLDPDLEIWPLSLSHEYLPELSLSRGRPPYLSKNLTGRALIMQLEYYNCLTVIHQTTSRYVVWVQGRNEIPLGISTSIALAVVASRSTLQHLRTHEYALDASGFGMSGVFFFLFWLALFPNLHFSISFPLSTRRSEIAPSPTDSSIFHDGLRYATFHISRLFFSIPSRPH